MTAKRETRPPTNPEREVALTSYRTLANLFRTDAKTHRIEIVDDGGQRHRVDLPKSAVKILITVLKDISQGQTLRAIPIPAELTTQEAADLLNVSRPYLIKLLESGRMPFRKVGRHRRIRTEDVVRFKEEIDESRRKALDELVAISQDHDMGY